MGADGRRGVGELAEAGFCGAGPDERRGRRVVGVDLAGDGDLRIGDGVEGAAPEASRWMSEKKPSTALSRKAEAGVKWNVQQG